MGNIHLVTGYAGREHVTAADMGAFNASVFGSGQYVTGNGNQLAASVITNNQIRVLDGDIIMQGRHIRLNPGTYVDLTVENGAQGMLRHDLIVARYTKDGGTGVEDCNLVVIKGTAAASNPSDPAYTSGDIINDNVLLNDMPLYRVPLDGLNVGELVCLFAEPLVDNMQTLPEIRRQMNEIQNNVDTQLAEYDEEIEEKIAGIKAVFPQIIVTTNASSTITCMKDGVSYVGEIVTDESGEIKTVTFDVPDYGKYTLAAQDGDVISYADVLVDMVAQYDIFLIADALSDYIFFEGYVNEALAGKIYRATTTTASAAYASTTEATIDGKAIVLSAGSVGWIFTENKSIDFAPFARVAIHVVQSSVNNWVTLGVGTADMVPHSSSTAGQYKVKELAPSELVADSWHYMDISDVTKSGLLAITAYSGGSIYIDQIKFERA